MIVDRQRRLDLGALRRRNQPPSPPPQPFRQSIVHAMLDALQAVMQARHLSIPAASLGGGPQRFAHVPNLSEQICMHTS